MVFSKTGSLAQGFLASGSIKCYPCAKTRVGKEEALGLLEEIGLNPKDVTVASEVRSLLGLVVTGDSLGRKKTKVK